MKILYLINVLIFSVLFYYKTYAQDVNWERIKNLNVSDVNSIAINSNDDIFVTAGDSLFRSTDGGNEWIKLNTPNYTILGLCSLIIMMIFMQNPFLKYIGQQTMVIVGQIYQINLWSMVSMVWLRTLQIIYMLLAV